MSIFFIVVPRLRTLTLVGNAMYITTIVYNAFVIQVRPGLPSGPLG